MIKTERKRRRALPPEYVDTAVIVTKDRPEMKAAQDYDLTVQGDNAGWYQRSKLVANGPSWSEGSRGRTLMEMEYFDGGEMVLYIHEKGKEEPRKIKMNFLDACHFYALMGGVSRLDGNMMPHHKLTKQTGRKRYKKFPSSKNYNKK